MNEEKEFDDLSEIYRRLEKEAKENRGYYCSICGLYHSNKENIVHIVKVKR